MIQVIQRSVDLLRAVRALDSAPLRELAAACDLPKTTAGNILRSLAGLGMLDQAPNGDYRIGAGLRELAAADPERTVLSAAAEQVVPDLAAELGETVVAVCLRGRRLDVLAEAAGNRNIVVHPKAIRDISPDAWATGRALLAWLSDSDPRRQPSSQPADFADELTRIRAVGVAFRRSPDGEIQSMAVPVLVGDRSVASIGLCLPVFRYAPDSRPQLVAALHQAAQRLASALT